MSFKIEKVAIIGGGVAGVAALYELLHTSDEGESTVGGQDAIKPAFKQVTLFERNDVLGGNWNYSAVSDPKFPSQEVLDSGKYNEPDSLDHILDSIPSDEELKGSDFKNPVSKPSDTTVRWSNSAAYPALMSNIIAPLVRLPNGLKHYDHQSKEDRLIFPFSTAGEIINDFLKFVNENDLTRYIRYNTTVERVRKTGEKWEVVARKINKEKNEDEWYSELFDGVIVANGHYSVPFIPYVENLNIYNKRHPDDLWHTKAVKEFTKFDGKDVLVVGSHASGEDVIRFLIGNAKSITVSKRSDTRVENRPKVTDQPELIQSPKIKRYVIADDEDPDGDYVEFIDGTTGKFDKIIYATGYHFHYPFLEDRHLIELGKIVDENSKYSLVKNLYLYAFNVQDPSFATIGLQQAPYLWASMESQAAAIAGVWSGASKLPTKDEQLKWLKSRNEEGVFHIYNVDTVGPNLVDLAVALAPKGRKHPFDVIKVDRENVTDGWSEIIRIYQLFKDKLLSFEKVRELDESKKALSIDPSEIRFETYA